jgi:catechol 2,3-dioxygenase-like lactoylglutathione lyase family enzyme
MSSADAITGTPLQAPEPGTVDYKLEVMVLPVSDVDRAKAFYASLGWREDADFPIRDGFRVIQMTPPGSPVSVIFGEGVTAAPPGAYEGLVLAVYDLEAAREDLVARGVEVSEIWHGRSGFDRFGDAPREPGRDPEGASYRSWASFSDPDGNTWLLQEIQMRLPGR